MDWGDLCVRAQLSFLRRLHKRSYRRFYRHFMRLRARQDPREAVGGMWDDLGRMQFDFLRSEGLEPRHKLLDIGCGALRAGIHFIPFLQPGNYTGIDVSEHIIEAGKRLLPSELLEQKAPSLLRNHDLRLREFGDRVFDFILAQSVFTHMPIEDIEECFAAIPRVLSDGGRFYFTIFEDEVEGYIPGAENFYYRGETIEPLCDKNDLAVERIDCFVHPRGQVMFRASRRCVAASERRTL